jgi:uncharacterized membrane protein YidH (DUF202 family)
MTPVYLFQAVWNLILIALFLSTYTYIVKLEQTGCACADHKYRKFVKTFPLVAVVYIVVFMFLSPAMIFGTFGALGKFAHDAIVLLFGLASIVFFVFALMYARFLMTEKCKCSEDLRRDVLYVWSMVQIVIIASLVVLMLLSSNIFSNLGATLSTVATKTSDIGHGALHKPVGSARSIPKGLRKFTR